MKEGSLDPPVIKAFVTLSKACRSMICPWLQANGEEIFKDKEHPRRFETFAKQINPENDLEFLRANDQHLKNESHPNPSYREEKLCDAHSDNQNCNTISHSAVITASGIDNYGVR